MDSAYPLIRNPQAFRNRRFDVLVVGGGIYGAWTAYDAAQRGLSVALIEKGDWASGTSSASSKLIHGGLRYLEHYDFTLVRHALAERRVLTQIAPHLVRPLRFVVPVYRNARAGMLKLGAGLSLYDWLAGSDQPVDRHHRVSRARFVTRYPFAAAQGLRGGFSYGDCQEDDARMTLAVVAAAQSCGAVCANRVEATSLPAGGGAEVRDTLSDERFTIDARTTVAATGPWTAALLGSGGLKLKPIKLVKGVHLVLPAIPGCDEAFLLTAPQDGRVFFVIPWYGRTLVGTTESTVSDPSQAVVTEAEVRYLIDAVAAQLPGLRWTTADVIASFAGVRSLQGEDTENLSAVTREFVVLEPRPGLVLPLGGKYTTSRCDAIGIVDRVQQLLGQPLKASRTGATPLPGAPPAPFRSWLDSARTAPEFAALGEQVVTTLLQRHGTRAERLCALIRERPQLAEPLHPHASFIAAEVELALREEMALSVDDVLRRRMPLRLLVPADDTLNAIEQRILSTLSAR